MAAYDFETMREHIGHAIECVCYGKAGEKPANVAVECVTCNVVLFDLCPDDHYEKFVPEE